MFKGEYWIIDGRPEFADGSVGEVDHTIIALIHIRQYILESIGWDGDSDNLCDCGMFFDELAKITGSRKMGEVSEYLQLRCLEPAKALRLLSAAYNLAEPREAVMQEFGWKWVKSGWVATYRYEAEDRKDISDGMEQVFCEDDEDYDQTFEIRVMTTGKSFMITLDELKAGIVGTQNIPAPYAPLPGQGFAMRQDMLNLQPCYSVNGD